jgi:hypothetical protein
MNVATDRLTLGPRGRAGVWLVATTFGRSSNSYQGLEPESARSSQPELASCRKQEGQR